tara:strand:+ start:9370 stop:11727 length:2358 start_codon:yes stop_codon:yes gene_type:complete
MNYINYSECIVTLNNRRVFATKASVSVSNNVQGTRNIDSTPHRQVMSSPIQGKLDLDFYITDEFEDLNPMRISNCSVENNIVRNSNFNSSRKNPIINEYERSSQYPRGNYGEFFSNNQMLSGWNFKTSHESIEVKVGLPEFKEGGANYEGHGIGNGSSLVIINKKDDYPDWDSEEDYQEKDIVKFGLNSWSSRSYNKNSMPQVGLDWEIYPKKWNPDERYLIADIVSYNNIHWRSKKLNINKTPEIGEYWSKYHSLLGAGAAEISQKDIFEVNEKYMVEIVAKSKIGFMNTAIRVNDANEVGILSDQYQTYLFEVTSTSKDLRFQFKGDDFFGQTVYIGSVKAYLKKGDSFHDGFSGSIGALTFSDAYMTKFSFSARPFSPILASASFDIYGPVSGQPSRDSFCEGNSNFHNNGILNVNDNEEIFDSKIPHSAKSLFYSLTDVGISDSLEFSYNLSIGRKASHQIGDLFPRSVSRGSSSVSMTLRGEGLRDALSFNGNDASISISLFDMSGKKIQSPSEGFLIDFDASGEEKINALIDGSYSFIDSDSSKVFNSGIAFKEESSIFSSGDSIKITDFAAGDLDLAISGDLTLECLFKISDFNIPSGWVRVAGRGGNITRTYGIWYNFPLQVFLFEQFGTDGSRVYTWTNRPDHDLDLDSSLSQDPLDNSHIRTDTWYHLTAIRNAAQNNLYINGKLAASSSNEGISPWTNYGSGEEFTLGTCGFPDTFSHIGEISTCRLYNRSLSEQEIKKNFTNFSCDGKIISQDLSVSAGDVLQGSITVEQELI